MYAPSTQVTEVQQMCRNFAAAYPELTLYRAICEGAATDDEVAGLLTVAPPGQARPVLFLAALHELVLRRPEVAAGRWYPSVTGAPVPEGDGWPDVRRTCLDHAEDLRATIASRATQTNEVNRVVHLAPLLAQAAADVPRSPVALVEMGASAGLLLGLDRYRIELSPAADDAGVAAPVTDGAIGRSGGPSGPGDRASACGGHGEWFGGGGRVGRLGGDGGRADAPGGDGGPPGRREGQGRFGVGEGSSGGGGRGLADAWGGDGGPSSGGGQAGRVGGDGDEGPSDRGGRKGEPPGGVAGRRGQRVVLGDPASPVVCKGVQRSGPSLAGLGLPSIVGRVGLDVAPVALDDTDGVRWLEACLWPEVPGRLERFRAAVALLRADPPSLVAGDMVDDLEAVAHSARAVATVEASQAADHAPASTVGPGPEEMVASAGWSSSDLGAGGAPRSDPRAPGSPGDAPVHLVVFSSWALTYVARERRSLVADALARLAADGRPVSWLTAEPPGCVPGIPRSDADGDASPHTGESTVLGVRRWRDGVELPPARWGTCHPHGTSLSWTPPSDASHPPSTLSASAPHTAKNAQW